MRRLDFDARILSLWERLQACLLVLDEPPSFADKATLEEAKGLIEELLMASEQQSRLHKFKGQRQADCPHTEYPSFRRFIFRVAHSDLVDDGTDVVLGSLVECPGCGQVLFAPSPAVSALVINLRPALTELGLGLTGEVFIEASGTERFLKAGKDTVHLGDKIFLRAPQKEKETS